MPKLKYAGRKAGPVGETAFASETGITWFPGTVKNVSDALAQRMLQHPDVFALAGENDPESDGDASAEAIEQAAPAVVVPQAADEDDKLTPAQRRIAAFAAADAQKEGDTLPDSHAESLPGSLPESPATVLAPGAVVTETAAQSAPVAVAAAAKKAAPAKKTGSKAKAGGK